jgi:hypothetical protein
MPAKTSSQPKNTIEATVAVRAFTPAAMPSSTKTMPNAKNHPQLRIISGVAPTIMSVGPYMVCPPFCLLMGDT